MTLRCESITISYKEAVGPSKLYERARRVCENGREVSGIVICLWRLLANTAANCQERRVQHDEEVSPRATIRLHNPCDGLSPLMTASPVASVSAGSPGAPVHLRRDLKALLFQEARLWSYGNRDWQGARGCCVWFKGLAMTA